MKLTHKTTSMLGLTAMLATGGLGFASLYGDEHSYDSLILENVEALTQGDDDYYQIRWKAQHGICYRQGLENGEISLIPTGQIYGYSIPDLAGSPTPHEHGCTFYCPGY